MKKFTEWDPKVFANARKYGILDSKTNRGVPEWVIDEVEKSLTRYNMDITIKDNILKNKLIKSNGNYRIVVTDKNFYAMSGYDSIHDEILLKMVYLFGEDIRQEDYKNWPHKFNSNFLCLHYNGVHIYLAESYYNNVSMDIRRFLSKPNKFDHMLKVLKQITKAELEFLV